MSECDHKSSGSESAIRVIRIKGGVEGTKIDDVNKYLIYFL